MTVPIFYVLGQAIPAGATPTELFTVDQGRQVDVETVTFCNQVAGATTVRVSVRRTGVLVEQPEQFLYYDYALTGNTTYVHRWTIKLHTGDALWVESANGSVSFNAFGKIEFV